MSIFILDEMQFMRFRENAISWDAREFIGIVEGAESEKGCEVRTKDLCFLAGLPHGGGRTGEQQYIIS